MEYNELAKQFCGNVSRADDLTNEDFQFEDMGSGLDMGGMVNEYKISTSGANLGQLEVVTHEELTSDEFTELKQLKEKQ